MKTNKIKSTTLQTLFAGLFVFAAALVLDWHCPIRFATGIPCPGCGATRAGLQLMQLDFARAWKFNQLVFVAPPVLLFLALALKRTTSRFRNSALVFAAAAMTVGFVIYRAVNLPSWL